MRIHSSIGILLMAFIALSCTTPTPTPVPTPTLTPTPAPGAAADFVGTGEAITTPFKVNSSPWMLEWKELDGRAAFYLVDSVTGEDMRLIHVSSQPEGSWLVFKTTGTYRLRADTKGEWKVSVIDYPENR